MRQPSSLLFSLLAVVSLVAGLLSPMSPVQAQATDAPPAMAGQAASLLPPGNSGFVNAEGQASGTATGDYGPNLDDQSDLYWGLEGYAGQGFADPAQAVRREDPAAGVRVYWDDFGVPAIYGDTGRDVWFGAGYSVAQIRLFLMDAVRRMGRGTFAELVGPSGVPADVQTRTLTYTDQEYEQMMAGLSADAVDAIEGYVEGANTWIQMATANPDLLPAEYALLTTVPEPLDAIDVLASGVLITRTVAAEGGQEMDNVALLRELEQRYGQQEGRGVFNDFVWNSDDSAVVTVPREEGVFTNQPVTDAQVAFQRAADFASTLPLELSSGPGTGDHPEPGPGPGDVPDLPGPGEGASGVGAGASGVGAGASGVGAEIAAGAVQQFVDAMRSLHGGSIATAIGPGRTADGGALLLSGPQLGYSYPSLLVELEVHGGGYNARGASVPALPTVGIGYTDRVAWALTTGYSKTIDSFIETVRDTSDAGLEYLHQGSWKQADCRAEAINYRQAAMGVPFGPPSATETVQVCRTVHGPVVAQAPAVQGQPTRLARSVQYQMFMQEVQTIEGILAWNRARTLEDFEAGMRQVTWNENTTYADADGHIAFWHPGIHRQRVVDADLRFPMPGDGSFDFGPPLPFEALPQAVDPAQGFLANWNNKPAHGWFDGVGTGSTSRPGGPVQRVVNPIQLVTSRTDHDFASLQALEMEAGLLDPRAGAFLPLISQALKGAGVRSAEVLTLLEGWNRRHNDPSGAPTLFNGPGGQTVDGTDGPAATFFDAIVDQVLIELFADVPAELLQRQSGVGSHVYDASPAHNLALRILDPASSSLTPSRDYTDGRSTGQVIRDAVDGALQALAATYGSRDLADYRRPTAMSTVDSLTGVIGPSATQPYQDRGSYIHVVAFDPAPGPTVTRLAGSERVGTSVEASRGAFPDGAGTVVVAAAGNFPDALTAGPLAGSFDAPLLLVDQSLSQAGLAEIARLGAADAIIVGGTVAVPQSAQDQLAAAGLSVGRVSGPDRFATAAAVARVVVGRQGGETATGSDGGAETGPSAVPEAFVVSGDSFPDALSVGGTAARLGRPILLTSLDTLPSATRSVLADLEVATTTVVGGTAVVSEEVLAQLPSASRIAGPDRYSTAREVLQFTRRTGLPLPTLVVATGANFPDGLTAGAVAAATDGAVVLVEGLDAADPGPAFDLARSQRAGTRQVLVLGGTGVINEDLVARLR